MRSTQLITLAFVVAAVACEDGPEQIYEPFKGNPDKQNGTGSTSPPWTQEGAKGFDDETASDSAGRAKFCDESEITAAMPEVWQQRRPDGELKRNRERDEFLAKLREIRKG